MIVLPVALTKPVPLMAACLLLNLVQSEADKTPLLVTEALGILSIMTGVEVPVTTEEDKSLPVVPSVNAAKLVTAPA